MVVGDLSAEVQERAPLDLRLDGGDGVAPEKGVPLDDLELLARELARLEQHGIGDAHLADVVQDGGLVDVVDEALVDRLPIGGQTPQLLRQHARVLANALEVGTGPLVAVFGQLGQAQDGGGAGMLELAVGLEQIHFQPLALGAVPQHAPEPSELAAAAVQRGGGAFDPEPLGVALQLTVEGLHRPARSATLGEGGIQGLVIVAHQEASQIPTEQLVPGAPQDAAGGVVDEAQPGVEPHLVVTLFDALQDGPVLLLALAQGLLGALAVVDRELDVRAENEEEAEHDDTHAHVAGVRPENFAVKADFPRGEEIDQRLQCPVGRRSGRRR